MNPLEKSVFEKTFWSMPESDVEQAMKTDIEKGLTEEEAKTRLEIWGRNIIERTKHTAGLAIFFNQFKSPLMIILVVAALVTFGLSHFSDAIFILVAVLVNAILGFYQEYKAERAIAELETYLKVRSRVIREGKEREIDTEELVPGDILRLSQGDRVPADARVIFVNDLQIDESILTGESLPVSKTPEPVSQKAGLADQDSMVFAGSLITQGVCTAIICRTHMYTEFGKIAVLISKAEHESTPLQKSIQRFSVRASILLGALTAIVFIVGIFSGYSWIDMFLTSVAIAISAIPEGLPVAMTVILSVGVQRMARRKGVVRKLIAAEALGSTTLILTDKTGTLTMAKMQLTDIIPLGDSVDRGQEALLRRALINAHVLIENPEDQPDTWRMNGKIMETALVRGAALRNIPLIASQDKTLVIQSLPFNAVQKFSVSLVKMESGKKHQLVFFGAPDVLLNHVALPASEKTALLARVDVLAYAGERVLGVAYKEVGDDKLADFSFAKDLELSDLKLEGLLTFRDPIRPQVKHAIERVSAAGIKTVIMTGDHKGTAQAIAKELGIDISDNAILDASELATISEEDLKKRLPFIRVISRVTPFDKLRIAKLYQDMGEVVAMTGDGVNDAPSIKQADVGIAMGSGTEVARSVADLVLLDDNFETIVAAVEEGRQIMNNIRKVLVYLLSNVTDGLILIGGSLLAGLALPLNALQILWVNFFSDSFPAIAFAFEKEKHALSSKPRRVQDGLFDPMMKFLILFIGISTSALLFIMYWVLLNMGFAEDLVRTFIFAAFGTYTLFVALSVRSLDRSIFSYSFFSNMYLLGGIGMGLLLMIVAIYIPLLQNIFDTVALPFTWVMAVIGVGILNIAIIELAKWLYKKR